MAGLIRILLITLITMGSFYCGPHLWHPVIASRSVSGHYIILDSSQIYNINNITSLLENHNTLKGKKKAFPVNGCEKKDWVERLGRYIRL